MSANEPLDKSSLHSSTAVAGVMIQSHDSPVASFMPPAAGTAPTGAAVETPWATGGDGHSAAVGTMRPATSLQGGPSRTMYENTSYFGVAPPVASSQLAALHPGNTSSYAQQAAAPRQHRPLQDIVSSMQGSFHFLQESQIELDSK